MAKSSKKAPVKKNPAPAKKTKSKKKFYAVAIGRKVGIYASWPECEAQTKGFRGARFKGFSSQLEAQEFVQQNKQKSSSTTQEKASSSSKPCAEEQEACRHCLSFFIHFDGGSRGNPGVAGAGAQVVVVVDTDETLPKDSKTVHIRKYLGSRATNNVAEYQGLLCGLRHAKAEVSDFIRKHAGETCLVNLVVKGDSDLIIQQLNESYECKSANLKPLYQQAKSVIAEMERIAVVKASFQHVYRKDNAIADALANEAMDEKRSWSTTTVDRVTAEGKEFASGADSSVRSEAPMVKCENLAQAKDDPSSARIREC